MFDGKANKKNFAPFISSYEDMFSCINILELDTETVRVKETTYNKEFIYLYAFILFEFWDELYGGQEEISSVQLADISFGKVFGWDEQKEYEVLEQLSDKGLMLLFLRLSFGIRRQLRSISNTMIYLMN